MSLTWKIHYKIILYFFPYLPTLDINHYLVIRILKKMFFLVLNTGYKYVLQIKFQDKMTTLTSTGLIFKNGMYTGVHWLLFTVKYKNIFMRSRKPIKVSILILNTNTVHLLLLKHKIHVIVLNKYAIIGDKYSIMIYP